MSTAALANYTRHHLRELLRGSCFFPDVGFRGNVEAMHRAWRAVRGEVLPQWTKAHPGTRPHAWWRFDAAERRRRIDGPCHPFENPERIARVDEIAAQPGTPPTYRNEMYALHYGKPRSLMLRDDFEAVYESEAAYLDRLDLLTAAERGALADADQEGER